MKSFSLQTYLPNISITAKDPLTNPLRPMLKIHLPIPYDQCFEHLFGQLKISNDKCNILISCTISCPISCPNRANYKQATKKFLTSNAKNSSFFFDLTQVDPLVVNCIPGQFVWESESWFTKSCKLWILS